MGRIYIGAFVGNPPSREAPWGRAIDDEWRSVLRSHSGKPPNGPPFITDRSSPWGGSRGGVFHKCSDIYTPHPKTAPYQGMLNIYFLSRETPRPWRVHVCLSDPLLGGGGWVLSPERVRCDTGTATPHAKQQSILHAEHP